MEIIHFLRLTRAEALLNDHLLEHLLELPIVRLKPHIQILDVLENALNILSNRQELNMETSEKTVSVFNRALANHILRSLQINNLGAGVLVNDFAENPAHNLKIVVVLEGLAIVRAGNVCFKLLKNSVNVGTGIDIVKLKLVLQPFSNLPNHHLLVAREHTLNILREFLNTTASTMLVLPTKSFSSSGIITATSATATA
jgi:hypothetical protein